MMLYNAELGVYIRIDGILLDKLSSWWNLIPH